MSTGPHVIHWKLRTSANSAAASSNPPPAAASQWSTIQWEGVNHLTTLELKRHITQQLGLAESEAAFDFILHNSNTGEEYKDDNFIVHRNTSVFARRINASRPRAQQLQVKPTTGLSAATAAAAQQTDSDDQQILALVNTASRSSRLPYSSAPPASYGPQQYQRASHGVREGGQQQQQFNANGKPPPSYICHRCGQSGHFIRHCLPEADTRILTNHGFLFLDEIEQRLAAGVEVLYGCYEVTKVVDEKVVESKQLRYCEGELVILQDEEVPNYLVEFTSENEKQRWAERSDAYGRPKKSKKNQHTDSCHVSLRVTPDHDMYVQQGTMQMDGKKVDWLPMLPTKEAADSLLPVCHCAQPECQRCRGHIRLLACAETGYLPQSNTRREAVRNALQLSDAQFAVFIELFGSWFGSNLPYGTPRNSVVFRYVKKVDRIWLQLEQLGLKKDVDWTCHATDTGVEELSINKPGWSDVFDLEWDRRPLTRLLPAWMLAELPRDEMRLFIYGLRHVDRYHAGDIKEINTGSPRLRDQLMQALLHCGYSAVSTLRYRKSTVRLLNKGDKTFPIEFFSSDPTKLRRYKQRGYRSIRALADCWKVSWVDMNSSPGVDSCRPSMPRLGCINLTEYNAERDKRIWCVSIAHPDQLIIVQRAERHGRIVTKQSRPIIVSNCPTNGDPAFDGRRPKAALAVQQYEQNAQKIFLRDVEDPKALERNRGGAAGGGSDGVDQRTDDRYHSSVPTASAPVANYATTSYERETARERERPPAAVADAEARLAARPDLLCPIDHRVFVEPTVVPCCFASFCRQCIERSLLTSNLCPRCKQPLDRADLRPNAGLQKKIQQEREGGYSAGTAMAASMPPPARRPYEENGYEERRDGRRGYSDSSERGRSPQRYDRRVADKYDGRDRPDDRDRGGRDDRDRDYRSRVAAYPPDAAPPRDDRYNQRPPPSSYPPPPPPHSTAAGGAAHSGSQRDYYTPPSYPAEQAFARQQQPYEQRPPPPPARYDNGRPAAAPYDEYRGGPDGGRGYPAGYGDGAGRRY